MATKIAVLESRWFKGKNLSVKPMFELFADVICGDHHAFHYETVMCEAAFKEAVPRIAKNPKCKYLYIATHGSTDGLAIADENISRSEIRNLLKKVKDAPRSSLEGIYLGSCLVGTFDLAEFLFKESISVKWIAGYNKSVDFIDSSVLDLLFFRRLWEFKDLAPGQSIQAVAQSLSNQAAGLVGDMGFNIYVRKQNTGGAKGLLDTVNGW